MNIYGISEKAGVSIATVSRVLNGNPRVSEKTRKKVLAVIEQYEYTPNVFARGLGLNTMNTVGILCADSSDPYLASAVYYLEQGLRENGYDALLCCTGYQLADKQKYLNLLLSKRMDSVILVGSNFIQTEKSDNQYIFNAAKEVPVMLLNGYLDGENIYSVLCDDFLAIYEAAAALIDHGIPDILYLYNSRSFSGLKKAAGFKAAMESRFLPVGEENIRFFHGTMEETCRFLLEEYKEDFPFHGILAAEDFLAVGALKFARKKNLSVPKDLSIIGYNNSILAQCCQPELTSIDNRLSDLCASCVTSLISLLSGTNAPAKTVLTASLAKRETTSF